jgi:hypothetical protein
MRESFLSRLAWAGGPQEGGGVEGTKKDKVLINKNKNNNKRKRKEQGCGAINKGYC